MITGISLSLLGLTVLIVRSDSDHGDRQQLANFFQ